MNPVITNIVFAPTYYPSAPMAEMHQALGAATLAAIFEVCSRLNNRYGRHFLYWLTEVGFGPEAGESSNFRCTLHGGIPLPQGGMAGTAQPHYLIDASFELPRSATPVEIYDRIKGVGIQAEKELRRGFAELPLMSDYSLTKLSDE